MPMWLVISLYDPQPRLYKFVLANPKKVTGNFKWMQYVGDLIESRIEISVVRECFLQDSKA